MSRSAVLSSRASLVLAAAFALAGAARASAEFITYTASLDGPSESPPNTSPGTGSTIVDIDTVAHTMRVRVTFSGLVSPTSASHIHAATTVPLTGIAGVATQLPSFPGFPLGVTAGTMDQTFDMTLTSSYNPSYITANGGTAASAEAALFAAMAQGRTYLNIHTGQFPGGEIRGFLVPAPGAAALVALGGVWGVRRRR
jgi:hypothetical protein